MTPIIIRVTRRRLRRIQRDIAGSRRWARWYARWCAKQHESAPLSTLVRVQMMMDAVDHRGRLISGSYGTNTMLPHRYVIARS